MEVGIVKVGMLVWEHVGILPEKMQGNLQQLEGRVNWKRTGLQFFVSSS